VLLWRMYDVENGIISEFGDIILISRFAATILVLDFYILVGCTE